MDEVPAAATSMNVRSTRGITVQTVRVPAAEAVAVHYV
jgi:hypothetical protein